MDSIADDGSKKVAEYRNSIIDIVKKNEGIPIMNKTPVSMVTTINWQIRRML